MDCQRTERLVVITIVMIMVGLSLPAYAKLAAGVAARGVELSWLHHAGLFTLAVLLGFAGLVLCGVMLMVAGWAIDRVFRLLRGF